MLQPSSCRHGLEGAVLPQVLALWPRKACYSPLWPHTACCSPLCAGRGLWAHSCHRSWRFGHARLVTALFAQAGAFGGILGTGLGLQGLLQLSSRRQGLGGILATGLGPQVLLQLSSRRQGFGVGRKIRCCGPSGGILWNCLPRSQISLLWAFWRHSLEVLPGSQISLL